ncbi:MAG: hypothetical protein NT065_02260 [Chlamydiae bacterium]|nr:hypothetical protein [Chlamydiota bacterium]
MATLVLTGDVTVGRTKDYIQADLWKKQCFIQLDLDKDPDQAVKQTFSFLLNELNKDLLRANKKDPNEMTFYFAK